MIRVFDFFSKAAAPDQRGEAVSEAVSEAAGDSDSACGTEALDHLDEYYSDSANSTEALDHSDEYYWATRANETMDSDLFGYLEPCSPALRFRIDLFKKVPCYMMGSSPDLCDIALTGPDIENQHCQIVWSGSTFATSEVCVYDLSSTGTYINGKKIGKGETRNLCSGDEICFAPSCGVNDYRYTYYHTADVTPPDGVHAEYDIGKVIGAGNYGNVSIAKHRKSETKWVVKRVVIKEETSMPTYEVHAMEKVGFHPNVCYLREVFYQYDSSINLILEHIEGGDLELYLDQHKKLSDYDAKRITYQICCAMAHVHSKGIIHRDLKPGNILLTLDNPPIVKVADFGLAMVDEIQTTRHMVGTMRYIAPECTRYEYSDRVDSWSMGIMVWSMLTGYNHAKGVKITTMDQMLQWFSDFKVQNLKDLERFHIELQAKYFILALLKVDPLTRTSLTHSRLLPWLSALTKEEQAEEDEVHGMLLGC